jgi:hypothetical protein
MTVTQWTFAASMLGALLFFIAGAAFGLLRRRGQLDRTNAHPDPVPTPDDGSVAELQAQLQRARAAEHQARVQLETARHDLATSRAELETARAGTSAIRQELEHARSAGLTVSRELEHVRGASISASRELDELRSSGLASARETDQLRERLHDLERQLAERTQSLRDLSTEHEQLKGRLRDAEGLRGDYVRLRTQAHESEFLRQEVARLEKELRAARARALVDHRPRAPRGTARPPTVPDRSIGASLARVIDRFADAGTRSTAIADGQGFPLASTGNDGQALAAYAALLVEAAGRAKELLPVAAPAAIELCDEHGARISVWTFDVETEHLLLANLAVSPVDPGRVEATLADLAAILAPTTVTRGIQG